MTEKSHLISPELQEQLTTLFARLTAEVPLTALLGEDDRSREMGIFLGHLSALSPLLRLRILAPGQDALLDNALDASLLPATGVGGPVPRMVFHGVPGGKEITAFAAAILNAGGAAKSLDWFSLRDIGRISAPLEVRTFVSLSCQHCCQLVIHAQRIAWENELVTAHMIDANLYPELVRQWGLERVPLTVVNRNKRFPGGKTMGELARLLAKYRD